MTGYAARCLPGVSPRGLETVQDRSLVLRKPALSWCFFESG
jgi:hypothetical protein